MTFAGASSVLFLFLVVGAAWMDVRHRRIPNVWNMGILVAGVAVSMWLPLRVTGWTMALQGVAVGLGCWIGFYMLGVLGAGDVKFFAALSAWLGPSLSWRAALLAALIGGVLSVGFLIAQSRLGSALRALALAPFLRSFSARDVAAMTATEAKRNLPYGVPMAVGAAIAYWYPELVGG